MNVIGYIRVSTEGQCGEDKFGLEVQEQQIKDTEQEIEELINKLETLEKSADAPKAVPAAEQK